MKKAEIKEEERAQELLSARIEGENEERQRIFTLVNYILNKNSFSWEKGIDYKKAYEEMEELEMYLSHD